MKFQSCVHPIAAKKSNIALYYMITSLPQCDPFYKGPILKRATVIVVSVSTLLLSEIHFLQVQETLT